MISQTVYWILLTIILFVIMFVLIPPDHGPKLAPFGFWMGLVQAVIILWFGQTYFKLFKVSGDQMLFGVPILTILCWVPLAILFAAYFSLADTALKKAAYIFAFAAGSAIVQHYLLESLGMWKNIHWNSFYTFILALVTHSIMTVFYLINAKSYEVK